MKTNQPLILMKTLLSVLALVSAAAYPLRAQTAPPYGEPIVLEQAKQVLAAAEAEAKRHDWAVCIAIVDTGGHLVAFQRMDTQTASITVALEKARTAAAFRRATKSFQESLAAGGDGLRILGLPGVTPVEGGLPLVHEGRLIGAIGVSGVTSAQDAQIGAAGAAVLQ